MRPGRHDLNVNFFTFRSCRPLDGRHAPYRPLGGRQTPIFENFPIRHIFLKFCFFNIKMKKKPRGIAVQINYLGFMLAAFSTSRTCLSHPSKKKSAI